MGAAQQNCLFTQHIRQWILYYSPHFIQVAIKIPQVNGSAADDDVVATPHLSFIQNHAMLNIKYSY